MKNIFLVNYTVQGVKTLDEKVFLSFYKKSFDKNSDTKNYNIKAIYGMNGSGKSAIIESVDILKNILLNSNYLSNPFVQKNLEGLVNKKINEINISADFVADMGNYIIFFSYNFILSKDKIGKYVISFEELSFKKATSKTNKLMLLYRVEGEKLEIGCEFDAEFSEFLIGKTYNLLNNSSFCALFFDKVFAELKNQRKFMQNNFIRGLAALFVFGNNIQVFMDQADDHRNYLLSNSMVGIEDSKELDALLDDYAQMRKEYLIPVSVSRNFIKKDEYHNFEINIKKLSEFIKIFKPDLCGIEIDKKEDANRLVCDLLMIYDSYKIDAEFESTGIKKLIKLYNYLREMVYGGIVFIDEFDSNLHDVYLCALLEYLMEYGNGQLCFTTHNVGPMDVLKKNKKSIDFLSLDHKIYPWITNGHYSPSKLYRAGMIAGSPFNVDSIDFIGVFDKGEDD